MIKHAKWWSKYWRSAGDCFRMRPLPERYRAVGPDSGSGAPDTKGSGIFWGWLGRTKGSSIPDTPESSFGAALNPTRTQGRCSRQAAPLPRARKASLSHPPHPDRQHYSTSPAEVLCGSSILDGAKFVYIRRGAVGRAPHWQSLKAVPTGWCRGKRRFCCYCTIGGQFQRSCRPD